MNQIHYGQEDMLQSKLIEDGMEDKQYVDTLLVLGNSELN